MIVSDEGQARVFLIYILLGMLCIALADLFYVLRKKFALTNTGVNVLDAIYYIIAFCMILYAGVRFNFGAVRYYQLFALLFGMVIHKLLFSGIFRKLFEIALGILLVVAKWLIRITRKAVVLVFGCLFLVTGFFEGKTIGVCHRIKKYLIKVKVKRKKKKKTVKKRLKMI